MSMISVNYFLKNILNTQGGGGQTGVGGSSENHDSMSGQHVSELDSSVLLDQSLKIDETINFIRECSAKIT